MLTSVRADREGKSQQQLELAGSSETNSVDWDPAHHPQTHSPDWVTQQVTVLGTGKG